MKKTGLLSVTILGIFLLSGCKEEEKSEAWYKQHPDKTYEVYKKCIETGSNSDNCDAARYAAEMFADPLNHPETSDKFRELLK